MCFYGFSIADVTMKPVLLKDVFFFLFFFLSFFSFFPFTYCEITTNITQSPLLIDTNTHITHCKDIHSSSTALYVYAPWRTQSWAVRRVKMKVRPASFHLLPTTAAHMILVLCLSLLPNHDQKKHLALKRDARMKIPHPLYAAGSPPHSSQVPR